MKIAEWLFHCMKDIDFPHVRNRVFTHTQTELVSTNTKKRNLDMDKYKAHEDCCYEQMTKSVGGQSQPQECWDEPLLNGYENTRKGYYGENGIDWSGMEK